MPHIPPIRVKPVPTTSTPTPIQIRSHRYSHLLLPMNCLELYPRPLPTTPSVPCLPSPKDLHDDEPTQTKLKDALEPFTSAQICTLANLPSLPAEYGIILHDFHRDGPHTHANDAEQIGRASEESGGDGTVGRNAFQFRFSKPLCSKSLECCHQILSATAHLLSTFYTDSMGKHRVTHPYF